LSAIRDFERLDELAKLHNLMLTDDIEMPANNKILVWTKI